MISHIKGNKSPEFGLYKTYEQIKQTILNNKISIGN